ncbi:hypothetical protein EKA85_00525 [Pseudomonas veronii]|nr:hypothetical protein EKA85_00525 [Pseudomonas veronii]RTY79906.1 hypothetical protein EKA83_03105 [Pseudomonas veronii]
MTPTPLTRHPVGASLLAKTSRALRSSRMPALSLTIFASKLAPTGVGVGEAGLCLRSDLS